MACEPLSLSSAQLNVCPHSTTKKRSNRRVQPQSAYASAAPWLNPGLSSMSRLPVNRARRLTCAPPRLPSDPLRIRAARWAPDGPGCTACLNSSVQRPGSCSRAEAVISVVCVAGSGVGARRVGWRRKLDSLRLGPRDPVPFLHTTLLSRSCQAAACHNMARGLSTWASGGLDGVTRCVLSSCHRHLHLISPRGRMEATPHASLRCALRLIGRGTVAPCSPTTLALRTSACVVVDGIHHASGA